MLNVYDVIKILFSNWMTLNFSVILEQIRLNWALKCMMCLQTFKVQWKYFEIRMKLQKYYFLIGRIFIVISRQIQI